jgi:hypothetical protein
MSDWEGGEARSEEWIGGDLIAYLFFLRRVGTR